MVHDVCASRKLLYTYRDELGSGLDARPLPGDASVASVALVEEFKVKSPDQKKAVKVIRKMANEGNVSLRYYR